MSEFDQIMKALQQLDTKLDKLMRASPELVASARLLRAFINQASRPKVDGQKRKRGRPPKNGKDNNSDSRSFEVRFAKAKGLVKNPKLMSVPEAANELRIGRSKMWQLVWSGEVKSVFVGRQRRVVAAALDKYIKEGTTKKAPARRPPGRAD